MTAEYRELKNSLLNLGPVIQGHLREVSLRCGKASCRCKKGNKSNWHGPYVFWDRYEGRRLTSRSIQGEHVEILRDWMENKKKLDRIVRLICKHGHRMVIQLRDRPAKKVEKSVRSTRGK